MKSKQAASNVRTQTTSNSAPCEQFEVALYELYEDLITMKPVDKITDILISTIHDAHMEIRVEESDATHQSPVAQDGIHCHLAKNRNRVGVRPVP